MIRLATFAAHSGPTRWITTDRGAPDDDVEVVDPEGVVRIGRIDSIEYRRRTFRRFWLFRRQATERRVRVRYRYAEAS